VRNWDGEGSRKGMDGLWAQSSEWVMSPIVKWVMSPTMEKNPNPIFFPKWESAIIGAAEKNRNRIFFPIGSPHQFERRKNFGIRFFSNWGSAMIGEVEKVEVRESIK
jgi:hypothetical protein